MRREIEKPLPIYNLPIFVWHKKILFEKSSSLPYCPQNVIQFKFYPFWFCILRCSHKKGYNNNKISGISLLKKKKTIFWYYSAVSSYLKSEAKRFFWIYNKLILPTKCLLYCNKCNRFCGNNIQLNFSAAYCSNKKKTFNRTEAKILIFLFLVLHRLHFLSFGVRCFFLLKRNCSFVLIGGSRS